jgi:hypothetical protein
MACVTRPAGLSPIFLHNSHLHPHYTLSTRLLLYDTVFEKSCARAYLSSDPDGSSLQSAVDASSSQDGGRSATTMRVRE